MESAVVWLDPNGLQSGLTPREREIDADHVAALAELQGNWPPILICGRDGRVIDGHHRVAAARLIGLRRVAARHFQGRTDEAFAEAVRRNVEHGLPLTINERRTAAQRLLGEHADWSDRRIAEVCALSPHTVGRLRAASGSRVGPTSKRVGRDGRGRLAQPESNRLRIVDAVRANPDASLRALAQAVGASPETVRRVRLSLDQPDPAGSAPVHDGSFDLPSMASLARLVPVPVESCSPSAGGPALTSSPDGRRFEDWFDRSDPGPEWHLHATAVPLSRVCEIAGEARRRASIWSDFAASLEQRAASAVSAVPGS